MADKKEKKEAVSDAQLAQLELIMGAMETKLNVEASEVLEQMTSKVLESESTPRKSLGLSDEIMEGMYSYGYTMYNRGMYEDASNIFRLLVMLDMLEPKYIMGLAASLHMEEKYEGAVQVYLMAAAMDAENPLPHFHAADCYLKLGSPLGALGILEMALKAAGDKPEFVVLKERAKLMIEGLKEAAEKELESTTEEEKKEQKKIDKEIERRLDEGEKALKEVAKKRHERLGIKDK